MAQNGTEQNGGNEPAGAGFSAPSAGVSLPDLAERLGLSTEQFRRYLDEYSDVLRITESRGRRTLDVRGVHALTQIHALTQCGLDPEGVRRRIGPELASPFPDHGSGKPEERSDEEVANDFLLRELREGFDRLEKRRLEDRDKLMLTLIKTQKEIQQLRYQLAAREGRSRKGFWARLFGR
ncbi:MAG: MerR family transcriptional regulator [Bacillota bacterium]